MTQNSVNHKELWAEWLRAVAVIAVVLLHVSATQVYRFDSLPPAQWHFANIANSAVRFCVPVFLMLTGAFAMQREKSVSETYIRLINRILLPFVFWGSIHVIVKCMLERELNVPGIFRLISVGISYHFWYVYLITAIYLALPFLSKLLTRLSNPQILLLLLIWPFSFLLKLNFPGQVPFAGGIYLASHAGYVVLGYYMMRMKKKNASAGIVLFVLGFVATAGLTAVLSASKGAFEPLFYQYLAPNVIVAAIAIFIFFRNTGFTSSATISNLSKFSYGIYLSHVMILDVIADQRISFGSAFIDVPLFTLAAVVIPLLMVYLVSKTLGSRLSG